jgi:15-cis-phytoene synthase
MSMRRRLDGGAQRAGGPALPAPKRESARGSSFYYGMRLLPRERRDALFAVYALARRIDDIADGTLPDAEKLRLLEEERAALDRLDGPLADAVQRFPIPVDGFRDLIDGAEMDVRGESYETFDGLLVYARRVGGSIGRLSLGVFGTSDRAAAEPLADDLGVALQLTNVLRDVREDLARGRVYLPREDLERYGVTLDPPSGPVGELVRFEAARAHEWFERGLGVRAYLDRPSATSVAAMAGMYRRLLGRIEREPESVLERRVSLHAWEKGWVAARSLIGAAA